MDKKIAAMIEEADDIDAAENGPDGGDGGQPGHEAGNDVEHLGPMLEALRTTLTAAGVSQPIEALSPDPGSWRAANVDCTVADAPERFISVAKHGR